MLALWKIMQCDREAFTSWLLQQRAPSGRHAYFPAGSYACMHRVVVIRMMEVHRLMVIPHHV